MVKNCIIILISILFASCIGSKLLQDGYTKVPKNNKVFKINNFNKDVFKIIDTNAIYIREYIVFLGNKEYNERKITLGLRFYKNGFYNEFVLNLNNDPIDTIKIDLEKNNLNYKLTGGRGYYNLINGIIELYSFGGIDQLYTFGKVKSYLQILNKNWIIQTYNNDSRSKLYYKKYPLPEKWINVKPNLEWE